MKKNYFLSGEWNVTCDVCSKKIKAHQAKHRWDGLIVCADDWEMRHEQDFVKAKPDKITVPFTRPIPTEIFTLLLPVFDNLTVSDDSNIQFVSNFIRDFTDISTVSDSYSYTLTKTFSDTVIALDNASILSNGAQVATDSQMSSDGGDLLLTTYVDITYIDPTYVGTSLTF